MPRPAAPTKKPPISPPSGQRAPRGGYFATPQLRLATGFADAANPGMQRYYYHLPHLAAAAWAALAEKHFNPFTASASFP